MEKILERNKRKHLVAAIIFIIKWKKTNKKIEIKNALVLIILAGQKHLWSRISNYTLQGFPNNDAFALNYCRFLHWTDFLKFCPFDFSHIALIWTLKLNLDKNISWGNESEFSYLLMILCVFKLNTGCYLDIIVYKGPLTIFPTHCP